MSQDPNPVSHGSHAGGNGTTNGHAADNGHAEGTGQTARPVCPVGAEELFGALYCPGDTILIRLVET
jgi:hypothetical protein